MFINVNVWKRRKIKGKKTYRPRGTGTEGGWGGVGGRRT